MTSKRSKAKSTKKSASPELSLCEAITIMSTQPHSVKRSASSAGDHKKGRAAQVKAGAGGSAIDHQGLDEQFYFEPHMSIHRCNPRKVLLKPQCEVECEACPALCSCYELPEAPLCRNQFPRRHHHRQRPERHSVRWAETEAGLGTIAVNTTALRGVAIRPSQKKRMRDGCTECMARPQ